MEIAPQIFLLLFIVVVLAGVIDAAAGGAGLITTPALFATGMPAYEVLATAKLLSSFGTGTSAFTFIRRKMLKPKYWIPATVGTIVGAILGALLILSLDASIIKKLLPPLFIAIGIYMLLPKPQSKSIIYNEKVSGKKQLAIGSGLGFYDGFAGPGAGSFWTVIAHAFLKQDLMRSAALARFMNFVSNVAAFVIFYFSGFVNWGIGITLGVAFMLGSYLGAHYAMKLGPKMVKYLLVSISFSMSGYLIYTEYFS